MCCNTGVLYYLFDDKRRAWRYIDELVTQCLSGCIYIFQYRKSSSPDISLVGDHKFYKQQIGQSLAESKVDEQRIRFAKVLGIASTVFLVIYTIFSVFPLIWMVIISFKSDVDMFKTLFIFKPTLDNFRNVLTTGNYVKAFGDNFIICAGAVLVLSLIHI